MAGKIEALWCKVPMDLILDEEITKSDLKVFGYIDYRIGKRGAWYMPISEIKEGVHLSDKMVRLAVEKLERKGYITTKRLGKEHKFVLLFGIVARTQEASQPSTSDAPESGNELPNSETSPGNQLPNTNDSGNTLPDPPVTDYRDLRYPITETIQIPEADPNTEDGDDPRAQEPTEPPTSSTSPLVSQVSKAARLAADDTLEALIADYEPKLVALGKSILSEARYWRADKPHGTFKNFRNWLDVAIRPSDHPPRASPSANKSSPNRQPEIAASYKKPERKAAS